MVRYCSTYQCVILFLFFSYRAYGSTGTVLAYIHVGTEVVQTGNYNDTTIFYYFLYYTMAEPLLRLYSNAMPRVKLIRPDVIIFYYKRRIYTILIFK